MPNNKSRRRRIAIAKGKWKKADRLNNANRRKNTVERRKNVVGPNDVYWRRDAGAKKGLGKLNRHEERRSEGKRRREEEERKQAKQDKQTETRRGRTQLEEEKC